MGVGAGGYGVNISASVNQGKGHEKGNGLTHTETTLDAGNKLTLNSGQDTTLKGAQVSGEQVTVNVGRDLTLQSQQDSDRYDAKQQEVSVGGGYTIGGTPNINISASKDKIHSNYDSVKEQTGIFAGKGGFDVNVKEHTQLDGAVIASTADKDKNSLDTGTLGWKDIDNQADFTAEHTGGSIGTGGPIGSQLVTNAAGGLLSNANNSGHTEGTTQSAISDSSVIIRNEDKQKQDVNELNRDTEHANDGSINPIFDKEKEQNRLKQAQLIGEIGNQAMDIIRTEGDIAGLKAQKDPDALAIAKKQLETAGKTPTEQAIKDQAYNNAMAQYGTGSDFQKAAQAVTGLLQGLAGDNLAGALANASSPYLATLIKQQVGEDNKAANAMAHAVLGAVVAELNNQSAAAGGLGAGGGELSAHVILNTLFPGKKVSDLTESEKQQVSALSQLAAGLAGGLTTGDMAGAITGSQAGKNAVENNALSDLVEAQAAGKTPQKVAEERINAEIEHYKKENCAGMRTGACSAKMAEDRDKFFREAASLGIDFVPVVGDFKSFAEADGWIDYTLAAAGTLPFAKIFTKPLKEAKLLLKAGDLDGANKLIKEASDGIPTKLPSSPASQSSSGVWKPDHGVEVNTGSGKQKDSQIWTETKKTDPVSNAYDHWDKHKSEFPEFQNSKQYVDAAHDFVNTPPKGTLIKERANGDTMYYNPATNTFAVKNVDGTPKTMFKPQNGLEYWEKQK